MGHPGGHVGDEMISSRSLCWSELRCLAGLCKYINGVHIWARAIDLEDICEERMIVVVGVNGFPAGSTEDEEQWVKWIVHKAAQKCRD